MGGSICRSSYRQRAPERAQKISAHLHAVVCSHPRVVVFSRVRPRWPAPALAPQPARRRLPLPVAAAGAAQRCSAGPHLLLPPAPAAPPAAPPPALEGLPLLHLPALLPPPRWLAPPLVPPPPPAPPAAGPACSARAWPSGPSWAPGLAGSAPPRPAQGEHITILPPPARHAATCSAPQHAQRSAPSSPCSSPGCCARSRPSAPAPCPGSWRLRRGGGGGG